MSEKDGDIGLAFVSPAGMEWRLRRLEASIETIWKQLPPKQREELQARARAWEAENPPPRTPQPKG